MLYPRIGPLSFLLLLIFLQQPSTLIDASTPTFTLESRCVNFTFPEGSDVVARELCFSGEATGPSPVVTLLENGTEVTEYMGGYTEQYFFENELQGLVASVFWKDDDTTTTTTTTTESGTFPCLASANGQDCVQCTICSDGSWSADCTNLKQGRNVVCEMPDPFFPFVPTYEYNGTLEDETPSPGNNTKETRVPSASPVPGDPTSTAAAPTSMSAAASIQRVGQLFGAGSTTTVLLAALSSFLVLSSTLL